MTLRRKFNLGIMGLLVLSSLILGACGDSASPTAASVTTAASSNAPTAGANMAAPSTTAASSGTAAAACSKLNLNTLTEQQLTSTIPNFPNRMVREFLEYRPYSSIAQFRKEIGKYVAATQVTEWEKYVFVPVDPNKSDADTLMQIPGVDSNVANALTSARPFANNAAFVQALSAKLSVQQAAAASCFLAGA